MFYNLDYNTYHPTDMIRVATIYNNTYHSTLKHTPKQVHMNQTLELSIMRRLKADNWVISHRVGYDIPVGQSVSVRRIYKPFEKHRSTILRETYKVDDKNKDGTYSVKNGRDETLKKYRRDLKPISE